jgi:hypothetical protein
MKKLFIYLLFFCACLQVSGQQIDKTVPKILSHKILPVAGYNVYDGFQLGVGFHNLQMPAKKITYYAMPAYAFNSKRITGYGGASYRYKSFDFGISGAAFSIDKGIDSNGKKIFADVYKIVPRVRFTLNTPEHVQSYLQLKVYVIGESGFDYSMSTRDSLYHPFAATTKTKSIGELSFNYEKFRKLFPYDLRLQFQSFESFYRINAEAHYFFNYLNNGGVQLRLFAAKFGYYGNKTSDKQIESLRYQPKLTAVTGYEDYTYSNYFIGRNEFEGFASQQIMMRDGGLKLRTDLFQDLQGRSDNWVASMNLNTTLPGKLYSEKFPVKLFLDVGTYAGVWKKDSPDSRFLYVAGVQISVLKDLLNVYVPIMYSKKFRDNLSSVPEENKLLKKISFSIDIHRFNLRRYEKRD